MDKFTLISGFRLLSLIVFLIACAPDFHSCDNSSCVRPAHGVPNCTIGFREEGSLHMLVNATCLEPNAFIVPSNRSRPEFMLRAGDYEYFSTLFDDDDLPAYARINCRSEYPADFDFEGIGMLDFFRVWRGQDRETIFNETRRIYKTNVEVFLTPEATGKYSIYSITNKSVAISFFIFAEKSSPPYLIGASTTRSSSHILRPIRAPAGEDAGSGAIILPCVTCNYNTSVHLYLQLDDDKWFNVDSRVIRRDPKVGFVLNEFPGTYKCTTGASANDTSDFVLVEVKSGMPAPSQSPTFHNLGLGFTNFSVVCTVSNGTSSNSTLKLTNIYARNPTESRLLIECLKRGNAYCGSHSYHHRKYDDIPEEDSHCKQPNCTQITGIHDEGIVFCSLGTDGIWTEYFTGLDGYIYVDWKRAPLSAILSPTWLPSIDADSFQTGTLYEFRCQSVGILFLKDPYVLSVKYKNGSVVQLAEMIWWRDARKLYLTADMDEIICTDNLWTTNEPVSSPVKVTVHEIQCGIDQFKCDNSQCIRDTWRCDGDRDCEDGSDEDHCSKHSCKAGHFQCTTGFCIPNEKKCNNKYDCADQSDESLATCHDTPCTSQEFKCDSGQCMPAHFLCDGDNDCLDESDESEHSCKKYYPKMVDTDAANGTTLTFVAHTTRELVCQVMLLPDRLKPRLEWHRDGRNITDAERLWKDVTGLKLALRFSNVTKEDQADYKCSATNLLGSAKYKVQVVVEDPDFTCIRDLDYLPCALRKCYFNHALNACLTEDEFHKSTSATTTTSTSTTTATASLKPDTDSSWTTTSTMTPELSEPSDSQSFHLSEGDEGLHWATAVGVTMLIVAFSIMICGGIFLWWKFVTKSNAPVGSARMRNDHEDEHVALNSVSSQHGHENDNDL